MPALPLDEAGKYVAIMAAKVARIQRELGELADIAEDRRRNEETQGG